MARGAWSKFAWVASSIVNAIPFHGEETFDPEDMDPYRLFQAGRNNKGGVVAYNPQALQAIQDGMG